MRRVSRRHRLEGHLWKQAVRPLGTATLTRGGVTRIGRCLTTPTELTRTASRNRRCEIPPKGGRRAGIVPRAHGEKVELLMPWRQNRGLPRNLGCRRASAPSSKGNRRIHRPDTYELQSQLANSLKAARTTITPNYAYSMNRHLATQGRPESRTESTRPESRIENRRDSTIKNRE